MESDGQDVTAANAEEQLAMMEDLLNDTSAPAEEIEEEGAADTEELEAPEEDGGVDDTPAAEEEEGRY